MVIEINKNDPFYRKCPQCGKGFITGHGNRNFCSPPSPEERLTGKRDCKTTFNNLKAKKLRDQTIAIHYVTINNLKILESLYTQNITTVNGEELMLRGFDPGKSTDLILSTNGSKIPIYRKYKLINLGNNIFKIEIYDIISKKL